MTAAFLILAITGGEVSSTRVAFASDAPPEVVLHRTYGDYVHISSTKPPAASAHGWWDYETKPGSNTAFRRTSSAPRATLADVTVQLQIQRGGSWVNVGAPGKERVKPGGGSANRANARLVCRTTAKNQWRSIVQADLVGVADTPERLVTPARPVDCDA